MRLLLVAVRLPGLLMRRTLAQPPDDAVPAVAYAYSDAAISRGARGFAVRTSTELDLFPLLPTGRPGTRKSRNAAGLEPRGGGIEWLDERRLLLTSEAISGWDAAPIQMVCCGA